MWSVNSGKLKEEHNRTTDGGVSHLTYFIFRLATFIPLKCDTVPELSKQKSGYSYMM